MTPFPPPISDQEREARMEKARRLMVENKIGAIVVEPGTSMIYFTGTRWGRSERTFALVLPAHGDPAFVVPAFEEGRAREVVRFTKDIRIWQEDESPYERIVQVLRDRGVHGGPIGFEETVRFFIFDGIRKVAPSYECVSADPVTAGCRMIKSPAEIALLKRANEITLAAIKAAAATMRDGMMQPEFSSNLQGAFRALGAPGGGLVLFGKYTASPHGTIEPQRLREGDFVLVDAGCHVEDYEADITRTFVFGKPTAKQRKIWELERKAQDAVLAAARPGVTCESVDAAARKVITDAGFGPGYKLPGLPHRTGHGIGLDGHEWTNLVRGNKTRLAPGMCFSDEPTIAIPGEFGIRLEDCFHVTENGAEMFTPQSESIDHPFA
jgi:Xaa-Pro dipeptidase